jgi:hypothetical protein
MQAFSVLLGGCRLAKFLFGFCAGVIFGGQDFLLPQIFLCVYMARSLWLRCLAGFLLARGLRNILAAGKCRRE